MRKMVVKRLMVFCVLLTLPSASFEQVTTTINKSNENFTRIFKYTNPITNDTAISMRDHCIIKVDSLWYCTGTSNPVWTGHNPGVRLLVSNDLIHWQQHSWLIDAGKLSADCPYNGRFWAPEIHYIKNKYWLTVNSGKVTTEDPKGMKTHSIWLFVSDKVTGPYKLVNGPLTPHYNNDATLFEDEDGQTYLYCSGNGLWQAKIDLPSGKIIDSIQKFLDKKQPGYPGWMVGGIEGPFVFKKDGTYFMFFSTWTRGYEVALLKSKAPLGPWELASPEPIFGCRKREYRKQMAIEGGYDTLKYKDTSDPYCETGHNALFIGPDGNLWNSCHYMIYKTDTSENKSHAQTVEMFPQMGIEPVTYKSGMFYINGPSWTEQIIKY
jgi:xylan 1,4-beta-xylosidase